MSASHFRKVTRVAVTVAAALTAGVARAALPDVAILLTDQQRHDAMSIVGTAGAHTPAMDALARSGVRFTHAFCATPQCSPARAALWTGRYPHRTGVMGNVANGRRIPAGQSGPLHRRIPNLAKVFAAAGYETAYFGKWHLGNTPADYGFAVDHGARHGGAEVTRRVVAFLARRRTRADRRPLLLVASWINPHDIYHINRPPNIDPERIAEVRLPVSLDDDLAKKPFPQRHFLAADQGKPFRAYTRARWKRYVAFYHQLTTQVDAEIGQVVRVLRGGTGLAPLIVFSSDHGDLGGAHGLPYKGPAMYEELIRIPLVLSWPGHLEPAVSDALVSHIDLLPTLCDLAGIAPPPDLDGASLRPLLTAADPTTVVWRDAVFAEYYGKQNWRVPIRMVRTKRFKFVTYRRYGQELYDLTADPHERINLAADPAHAATRKALAARLDAWTNRTKDPFVQLTVTDRKGKAITRDAE